MSNQQDETVSISEMFVTCMCIQFRAVCLTFESDRHLKEFELVWHKLQKLLHLIYSIM